eukprot:TRINITY_DN30478_c0_g1_i1.p1 TRINITY_DN30478_c0_g1~~TRINITY_DN30478_c0_g1_i1.p1  ORF type:complete len:217 (-),score=27.74 TRINITY_DN30478_c0_g1_i1:172-822(-)
MAFWSSVWPGKKSEPPKEQADLTLWQKAPVTAEPKEEPTYGFNGKWMCPKSGKMIYVSGTKVFWDSHGSSSFEKEGDARILFKQAEKTYSAELDVESQKVVWSTGDYWIRFMLKEFAGREEEFRVVVAHRGQSIGFTYRQANSYLAVKFIYKSGIIETWNLNNPRLCVEVGDKIVAVNGQNVSSFTEEKLSDLIRKSQDLELLVRKPWYTAQRHDN